MRVVLIAVILSLFSPRISVADDPVFSGPQVGEKLVAFKALGVLGDLAGKEIDLVSQASGKPVLLIFLHDPLTRPSAAVTRALSEYAALHKDKLQSLVVFLKDDKSAAEDYIRRAQGSLNFKIPVAVSLDGVEGPGAYGLNRSVGLTILIGNENRVTANYALVQPSTTDGPRIAADISKVLGVPALTQDEFDKLAYGNARVMSRSDTSPQGMVEIPRELLVPVINKQATTEQLKTAVTKVEEYIKDNKARQAALGGVASRVVNGGKLENYGTPAAQEQLKAWAKKYGPEAVRSDK